MTQPEMGKPKHTSERCQLPCLINWQTPRFPEIKVISFLPSLPCCTNVKKLSCGMKKFCCPYIILEKISSTMLIQYTLIS